MQPSDRVVAKVIMKMVGIMGATLLSAKIHPGIVNDLLEAAAHQADGGDLEVRAAVEAVRNEVAAEARAEKEGNAVSTLKPGAGDPFGRHSFSSDNYD